MISFNKRQYIHAGFGILTILCPFLGAVLRHNNWLGVMGCFGALIFMYYTPVNKQHTMNYLLLAVGISTISFPISAVISRVEWVGILWIALLAFIVEYVMNANKYIGPGVFFILMINGMITSLHQMPMYQVLLLSVFTILGTYIAFLMASIENKIYENNKLTINKIKIRNYSLDGNIKALIIGLFSLIAYFIGYSLHINNYYWILVSALTILQSEDINTARKRQLEYICAGLIGTLIAFIIYSYVSSIPILIILSMIFMGLICLYMPKSYLVGNFFTTPIALILFKIVRPDLGDSLIETRILAIIIGTIIGLLGIWYYDSLNHKL
ncbi:FUSC family protein [Pediococcus pentosaceus]|uniref:FUSC family protein n=1 Tax=Pediococcus pentosaceus TaxID=1255 RepID=UPI0031689A95